MEGAVSDISIGGGSSYYAQAIQQLEQRLFGQIDTSGSGSITKSELEQAVGKAGGTTASADALYAQLDPSNSGSVSEQQFAQNLPLPVFSPEMGAQLISAQAQTSGAGGDQATQFKENLFQQLTNGSGTLTKSELEQAVTAAGGTVASADALYAKLDPNNTGSVSEQQFLQNLPGPHGHHHHHGGGGDDATASAASAGGSAAGTDDGGSAEDALMALLDSLLQQNGTNTASTGDGSSQTGSNGTGTTAATATPSTTSNDSAQAALFDLINNLDPSSQTASSTSATSDTGNSADDALFALLNASNGNASTATSADAASNQNSTPASLFAQFNQQILALMVQMQSQGLAA